MGGTNPKQIGLGVKVGEIGRDWRQGNVQTTGRTTDLNIQGEGFFVVENGGSALGPTPGVLLTRAGNFTLDADGIMTTTGGLRVVGTSLVTSETAGTAINPGDSYVQIPRTLNIVKTYNGSGEVTAAALGEYVGGDTHDVSLETYSISTDGAIEATYSNGDRLSVMTNSAAGHENERILVFYPTEGGTGLTVSSGLTINNTTAGNPVVSPHNLQMQFATVTNPAGLVSVGDNLFNAAVNSGTTAYAIGRAGGVGMIDSGGLETSNVDLTQEFSQMMLSQRALEASSRAFDTHNSILQTIVNMAR